MKAIGRTQRNTRQREVVLEELRRMGGHPTAAELYAATRARLPKISLGTVYRNLEILAENGAVRRLEMGGAEARFDGSPGRHYHVRCVQCDRVDDVRDLPEDFAEGRVQNLAGYDIVGFRLDFMGVCPNCRSGTESERGGTSPRKGR